MTEEDYIRKAVELADGWHLEHEAQYIECSLPKVENCPQPLLDAIAAQLVRQVDELDGYSMAIGEEHDGYGLGAGRALVYGSHFRMFRGCLVADSGYGKDRTMNTIKAIVDSKVLGGKE